MDKELRNALRNAVVACRQLLEEEVRRQLEGTFGVRPDGVFLDESEFARKTHAGVLDQREKILASIRYIESSGVKRKEAVEQFVRETAFTILNRLAALKLMEHESRGLIQESIGHAKDSKGFLLFQKVCPEVTRAAKNGDVLDGGYRLYLEFQFDDLAAELGVLFEGETAQSIVFPGDNNLKRVLEVLNSPDLSRVWGRDRENLLEDEAGDETIGWVYQYFTPKELRDRARRESPVPQNSYELAFRNQFYTPRYVVQFLVENTLGRIWHEARKGATQLRDHCSYFVRRPNEVFLKPGESAPKQSDKRAKLSQDALLKQPAYVSHRPKKDPRDLVVLDPAVGSGHFLLYSYELFVVIYYEAWEDPESPAFTGTAKTLREDYPEKSDLAAAIPGLILRHNLFGIDIDLRSTQIAALALWLRAQRSFQEYGLKVSDRPPIDRPNLVCAEPMPGAKEMLDEFLGRVQPKLVAQLASRVFEKMNHAGEAGILLMIEEDIRDSVSEAKKQWQAMPKAEQYSLWPDAKRQIIEQQSLFDLTGVTNEEFWATAEAKVFEALEEYAKFATNGKAFIRGVFSDDVAQGFRFIDVCRRRFDVVLMNPPFGSTTPSTRALLLPSTANNLYSAFVVRALRLCRGVVGTITDRSFLVQDSFKKFRQLLASGAPSLEFVADLGWGVLDTADVQVAAYTIRVGEQHEHWFLDVRKEAEKETKVQESASSLTSWHYLSDFRLKKLPNMVFAYSLPERVLQILDSSTPLADIADLPRGLGSNLAGRTYRAWFEVADGTIGDQGRYRSLCNGGDFSPFYRDYTGVADWVRSDGSLLVDRGYEDGFIAYDQRKTNNYFSAGLSFPKQSTLFNVAALPEDAIPTREGKAIVPENHDDLWPLLGLLNSTLVRYLVDATTGLHKQSGAVGKIPVPSFTPSVWTQLGQIARQISLSQARALRNDESSRLFVSPECVVGGAKPNSAAALPDDPNQIDEIITQELSLDRTTILLLEEFRASIPKLPSPFCQSDGDLLSYCVGAVLGRWDIRFATGESSGPELLDPCSPLPAMPPGMLVGCGGPPATESPKGYPLPIVWDGVLVSDVEHPDDIVRRVRDAFELLWRERAEAIEKQICASLGFSDLRSYFTEPRGFFDFHISRYAKSRRTAPIYWLLQSQKKSYSVWLYYHRLNRDIVFKIIRNYVEPKIKGQNSKLRELQNQHQKEKDSLSPRQRAQVEKEIDILESLLNELNTFKEGLEQVVKLDLNPDLNDGVLFNIAPFHSLTPWSAAAECWDELLEGKYEWSTISRRLRSKGLIKNG